jgi:hypothetical protein
MSATISTSPADHLACPHSLGPSRAGPFSSTVREAGPAGSPPPQQQAWRRQVTQWVVHGVLFVESYGFATADLLVDMLFRLSLNVADKAKPSGPPLDDPKLGAICLLAADVSQWQRSRFY